VSIRKLQLPAPPTFLTRDADDAPPPFLQLLLRPILNVKVLTIKVQKL